MFSAVILMAGNSTRCDLGYNKTIYEVNKKPLFMYSVEAFKRCFEIDDIILVVNKTDFDKVLKYTNKIANVKVFIGGDTRMESSYIGVNNANQDIVLIHDAARPLIKENDIKEIYEKTLDYDCCVACTELVDTIKKINGEFISITIDRKSLLAACTPQGVNKDLYIACYEEAIDDKYEATDDASIIEKYSDTNVSYHIIKGSNIKVTTQDDLEYVNIMLNKKK